MKRLLNLAALALFLPYSQASAQGPTQNPKLAEGRVCDDAKGLLISAKWILRPIDHDDENLINTILPILPITVVRDGENKFQVDIDFKGYQNISLSPQAEAHVTTIIERAIAENLARSWMKCRHTDVPPTQPLEYKVRTHGIAPATVPLRKFAL